VLPNKRLHLPKRRAPLESAAWKIARRFAGEPRTLGRTSDGGLEMRSSSRIVCTLAGGMTCIAGSLLRHVYGQPGPPVCIAPVVIEASIQDDAVSLDSRENPAKIIRAANYLGEVVREGRLIRDQSWEGSVDWNHADCGRGVRDGRGVVLGLTPDMRLPLGRRPVPWRARRDRLAPFCR
jgi:hypothetical protein